jgi:hypothetical protein
MLQRFAALVLCLGLVGGCGTSAPATSAPTASLPTPLPTTNASELVPTVNRNPNPQAALCRWPPDQRQQPQRNLL